MSVIVHVEAEEERLWHFMEDRTLEIINAGVWRKSDGDVFVFIEESYFEVDCTLGSAQALNLVGRERLNFKVLRKSVVKPLSRLSGIRFTKLVISFAQQYSVAFLITRWEVVAV